MTPIQGLIAELTKVWPKANYSFNWPDNPKQITFPSFVFLFINQRTNTYAGDKSFGEVDGQWVFGSGYQISDYMLHVFYDGAEDALPIRRKLQNFFNAAENDTAPSRGGRKISFGKQVWETATIRIGDFVGVSSPQGQRANERRFSVELEVSEWEIYKQAGPKIRTTQLDAQISETEKGDK